MRDEFPMGVICREHVTKKHFRFVLFFYVGVGGASLSDDASFCHKINSKLENSIISSVGKTSCVSEQSHFICTQKRLNGATTEPWWKTYQKQQPPFLHMN